MDPEMVKALVELLGEDPEMVDEVLAAAEAEQLDTDTTD